eukprot:2922108-Alexandrium_andersonii.AAC.1
MWPKVGHHQPQLDVLGPSTKAVDLFVLWVPGWGLAVIEIGTACPTASVTAATAEAWHHVADGGHNCPEAKDACHRRYKAGGEVLARAP